MCRFGRGNKSNHGGYLRWPQSTQNRTQQPGARPPPTTPARAQNIATERRSPGSRGLARSGTYACTREDRSQVASNWTLGRQPEHTRPV